MHYLALGDSISIDDYTGVSGGGAASQLAIRLKVSRFQDRTRNGNVTTGVLMDLEQVDGLPDLITLTVGGNDLLLMGEKPAAIVHKIEEIADRLSRFPARTILNTVYDPTDGDDSLAAITGIPLELRAEHRALNAAIREIAERCGFLLADLERLFHGHGLASSDCWYTQVIEPNYQGATAIAGHWFDLVMVDP